MNLSQTPKHIKVVIKTISAQSFLKKRLLSLGLSVGKEIEVTEMSLQKNTIKIALGFSAIALRMEEAQMIEVEVVA
ncbi:MAG: FeoA family protein [Sulfurospirillaceae bacterium]|nr:FeoA family protein [Sulfurospirillaceae bacterium]